MTQDVVPTRKCFKEEVFKFTNAFCFQVEIFLRNRLRNMKHIFSGKQSYIYIYIQGNYI